MCLIARCWTWLFVRLKGDRGQNVILHFELLSSRMKGQTPPKGGGVTCGRWEFFGFPKLKPQPTYNVSYIFDTPPLKGGVMWIQSFLFLVCPRMVTMINIHTIPNTLFSAKTPIPLHSSKYLLVIPSISMMWNPSITVRSSPRSSGPHRTNRVPCKVLQCKAAGMSWPLKRPPLKGHKFSENPMEWQLVMFDGLLFWWKGWCLMISWWCFRLSKPSNIKAILFVVFSPFSHFCPPPRPSCFMPWATFRWQRTGAPFSTTEWLAVHVSAE